MTEPIELVRARSMALDARTIRLAWLLIALIVVSYLPVILRGGYVWDDDEYLTNNALVQSPDGLADIWLSPHKSPQYYPMVFTTFWLEYRLWGLSAAGYHVVNVLLHAASALLVWRILTRLKVPGAWLAAALWGVHPVMVESVAWITERKNVLSGFFYLAAMMAYLPLILDEAMSRDRRRMRYFSALGLFVLALLSKSVACSFPVAVLILTWYRQRKLRPADAVRMIPFFILGAAAGLNTAILERTHVGAMGSDWAFTWLDRVLIAGHAVWFYIATLCFPAKLMFMYPRWSIDPSIWWQWLYPVAAFMAVLIAWWASHRWSAGRAILAAMLFFGVTIFPALGLTNIYPMRFTFVADHYQYLASLGFLVLIAAGLVHLSSRIALRMQVMAAAALLFILILSTAWQMRLYADAWTLWTDTVAKNPNAWAAYDNLAAIEIRRGHFEAAWEDLQRSLALKPQSHVEVYRSIGAWYYAQNRYAEAENPLKEALQQEGSAYHKGMAANMLGAVAVARKDYPAAATWFATSTQYLPNDAAPWMNLAHVEKLLGNTEKAQAAAKEAARLQEHHD